MQIKIRFNTDKDRKDNTLPPWRLLLDGQERLVHKIKIAAPAITTMDEVAPGVLKWHISCDGDLEWNAEHTEVTIVPCDRT